MAIFAHPDGPIHLSYYEAGDVFYVAPKEGGWDTTNAMEEDWEVILDYRQGVAVGMTLIGAKILGLKDWLDHPARKILTASAREVTDIWFHHTDYKELSPGDHPWPAKAEVETCQES